MKNLNRIKNFTVFVSCVFAVFLCTNLQADAAYYVSNCNSPCPSLYDTPCAPSRTICEGNRCTTYCNTSHVYNLSRNYTPGVTFSYSTPNVSFSISNEYVGLNIVKFNGRPAVYHHKTYYSGRPIVYHKPVHRPVHNILRPNHRPGHINNAKPVPNRPHKPDKPAHHKA